jgi:macrodomain Ter protein organizer (MatP/YcbG family)
MAKETFTYATDRKVKEKAANKAKREKLTLSEKIDQMLRDYVKPVKVNKDKCIDLPKDYINMNKIGVMRDDGTIDSPFY